MTRRPPGRRGGGGRGPRVRKGAGRGASKSGCLSVIVLVVGLALIAVSVGGALALLGRVA
jgi:hypothetical protein